MNKKKLSWFERYLFDEIGIEFKACLYFFAIMFFYCSYRLICHKTDALILHMAEMIFLTYIMGYVQTFLLGRFDEADTWDKKSILYMLACSVVFGVLSYVCKWFDRSVGVSIGFTFYMCFMYICCFWLYKIRRRIDEKIMNQDLQTFQSREKEQ